MSGSEESQTWADRYRDKWKWDKIAWGSHSVDCYPGGCPFRVYVRGGKIVVKGDIDKVTNSRRSITGKYLRGDEEIEVPKQRRPVRTRRRTVTREPRKS